MNRWPVVPLAEVASCLDSQRIPIKEEDRQKRLGSISYYGANGQVGWIDKALFNEPLLLIAEDGGHFEEPEKGVAYTIQGPAWVNNHAHVLRPDERKILLAFLGIYFRHFDFLPYITGTTRAKLTQRDLMRVEVPLPPLAEQERIANLLEQAHELRKLRTKADRRTSELIPALFQEMFGDLMKNSKGWEVKELGEVASPDRSAIRMGPFGSQLKKHELVCDGIKVLWIENVVSGNFEWKDNKCITREKYELLKGFSVRPSDVLITTMGTIGRCCVVPDTIGTAIISSHLIKITPNLAIVNPIFISEIVKSEYAASFYSSFAHGAIMKGLNTTIVKSLPIPIPPLALQKEFAMRVAEIRELEIEQAASRHRLDALFQSLLHHAFQGDL